MIQLAGGIDGQQKGKACAKLKEKLLDVINQPLLGVFREGEEVEDVGVFEGLLGEVGLG